MSMGSATLDEPHGETRLRECLRDAAAHRAAPTTPTVLMNVEHLVIWLWSID